MHIDPTALANSIARLERDTPNVALEEALERICMAAASVFEVTGTGLMFIDEGEVLRFVASSDEPGRIIEKAEEQHNAGPCVSTFVVDRPVPVTDLAIDERWPELQPIAQEFGVRAMLGVPVRLAGGPVGSLNAYCNYAHAWDESQVEAMQAYAQVVSAVVASAVMQQRQSRVVDQLQYALDHRVVIERAIGLLMGQFGIDAMEAFGRLRLASRNSRRKVGEIAAELLDGKPLP
jgi:GAF domain-containing protein